LSGRPPAFRRIMLKVSGEALMGSLDYGTDPERVEAIAGQIAEIQRRGVEVAVVCGAGNIYRGLQGAASGMDRATGRLHGHARDRPQRAADPGRAREAGLPHPRAVGDPDPGGRRAVHPAPRDAPPREGPRRDLRRRHGQPVLHHRHAAALRAVEVHAEAILMAKNGVEGVYTGDPKSDPTAEFLPEITHMDALRRGLRVMDSTALTLCMENKLPIHVFNMDDERNIERIVSGERVGTLVSTPETA
jgi:uridylate kinase